MAKYTILVYGTVAQEHTVEADSISEAHDLAEDIFYRDTSVSPEGSELVDSDEEE